MQGNQPMIHPTSTPLPEVATNVVDEDLAQLRARYPRVAIAHEWLTIPGGSEKVVLGLLDLFPEAEIFTSVFDPGPWPTEMTDRPVHASFLNRVPRAPRIYPKLLPFMNAAVRSFDLTGFDLVLSSNHACAKTVRTPPGVPHVCYCHTPMRYAWEPDFLRDEALGPAARALIPPLVRRLRPQAHAAAQNPDLLIANSRFVAARIEQYYRRDARVVHPPVDVAPLLARPRAPEDYYLVLGRVVPYKRTDVAVAACERLGRPVKVVGEGRALDAVRAVAGPNTELLGYVADRDVAQLLSGARALLFPGEEDFGIVPVEAPGSRTPGIAYGQGGIRDSVVDRETGLLYDEPSVDALCEAMLDFDALELDEAAIRDNARRFSQDRFRTGMTAALQSVGEGPAHR